MSWHSPETSGEKFLGCLLSPLSAFYFAGSYLRLSAFKQGYFKQTELPVPVISLGNLTVGGTGKTPLTIDLAQRLTIAGYKVAVLSRGYKRKSKDRMLVVSDGKKILANSQDSGDEPFLIASSVPEAVVIVGSSRKETAAFAVSNFGVNIILLDDGFQHLAVKRDIDIVLLDYNDDLETLKLLPAGRLREPVSALARANRIVITKVPQEPDLRRLQSIEQTIRRYAPSIDISSCRFVCDSAKNVLTKEAVELKGRKIYALCGIARPENFFQTLTELGADIVAQQALPDHHWLTQDEWEAVKTKFITSKADLIVITEKDRVRMPEEFFKQVPVAELKLSCQWLDDLPLACCEPETKPCTTTLVKGTSL